MLLDGRREKAPELPEHDGKGDCEPDGETHLHGGEERLGHAQRDRLRDLVGQWTVEPVDQPVVEDERDREADGQRPERDEETRAELVEMLDERRLLAVAKTAR